MDQKVFRNRRGGSFLVAQASTHGGQQIEPDHLQLRLNRCPI